jgi:Xaa-Pro dipeptidase
MQERDTAALLVEPGASLEYFTGIRWWRSERMTVAVIPAHGEVLVVTPAFEEPSIRETLQVGGDVRNEHENPIERIIQGLRDRDIGRGTLAVESRHRWMRRFNPRAPRRR